MAAWDIDPAGVAAVTGSTRGIVDGLIDGAGTIRGEMAGATAAAGSGPVGPALDAFLADRGADLEFVIGRGEGCLTAVAGAVEAYRAGDEQMAAHAQAAAATAGDALPLLLTMPR